MTGSTLISTAELNALGIHANEVRSLLANGKLVRIRHGAYSYQPAAGIDAHLQLLRATLPYVDPGNVVSHATAAVLHGIPVPASELDRIWMTRRTPGHGDHGVTLVARATPITDVDVTTIDGMATTTLARTAMDLARTLQPAWGLAAADAALRAGAQREELFGCLGRHPRLHGVKKARASARMADALAESPAESISRLNMMRAGLPMPELQVEHFDANGEFVARTDFFWPEFGLVGEVDGMGKYGALLRPGEKPEDVIRREKVRDERLRRLGYWSVHWGWATANDAQALATLLLPAMRSQGARPAG